MTQSLGYKLTAAVTNMAVQSYIVDHTISNCIAVAMTDYNLMLRLTDKYSAHVFHIYGNLVIQVFMY